MDVREKLVEVLKSVLPNFRNNMAYWGEKPIYEFADCLLANGVTVQECELGDKKTNSDRIRNMTDEELAEFLCNFRSCNADEYICEGCKAEKYCRAGHEGTIDWLQQPEEVSK